MPKSTPPGPPDWSNYKIDNPEEFMRNMLRLFEEGGRAMSELAQRADTKGGPYSMANELSEAGKVLTEVASHWMTDPARAVEAQTALARGYMDVWTRSWQKMMGHETEPVVEPEPSDSRFRDP